MRLLGCSMIACGVLACATGEGVDDEGYQNVGGGGNLSGSGGSSVGGGGSFGGGTSGGSGGTSATGGVGGATGGTSGFGGATGGAGGTQTGGTGGTGNTGATGGTGGTGGIGGGTGGTGGSASCAAPAACAGAEGAGSVSGDTGGGVSNQSGDTSKWVKIRVTENDSGLIGHTLLVTASLTVDSATDYDLYAYVVPSADVSACGTAPFKKSDAGGIGASEQVAVEWGEGLVPNGTDDSRWVVFEVRHKSGSCESNPWQLTLKGN